MCSLCNQLACYSVSNMKQISDRDYTGRGRAAFSQIKHSMQSVILFDANGQQARNFSTAQIVATYQLHKYHEHAIKENKMQKIDFLLVTLLAMQPAVGAVYCQPWSPALFLCSRFLCNWTVAGEYGCETYASNL